MLGLSTTCVESCLDWSEFLLKNNIRIIEINHLFTPIHLEEDNLKKIKEIISCKNLVITLHSGTTYLLHPDNLIREQQLILLRSEIKLASELGIKHIVFHLHFCLNPKSKIILDFFDYIIRFANNKKVVLCLENNSHGHWSGLYELMEVFEKFKKLKHVIDLGHLNISAKNKKQFIAYLQKMKPYTEYLHIHDNNGRKDEHNEIGIGNLNLQEIFQIFSNKNYKFIIEARNFQAAVNSVKKIKSKFY